MMRQSRSRSRSPAMRSHSPAMPDHPEVTKQLLEYQEKGVPKLKGFEPVYFSRFVIYTLKWAQNKKNLEKYLAKNGSEEQAVITEIISTEADYLKHLELVVDVFLAVAHALQDSGFMLFLETEKLFLNIPDIYNANRDFWEDTLYPMIEETLVTGAPFNAKSMLEGFQYFPITFKPYEKYATYHNDANDYLKSLSNNSEFATYLAWCQGLKECQRLQLTDLLVKPIQRITKYNLMLKRLAQLTSDEAQKNNILEMDQVVKGYVTDLNRYVTQRQALERTERYIASVENYDAESLQANLQEFKDEVDEYYLNMFSQTNLRAPMLNCHSQHTRTVIHVGDLRFKDGSKEIEVRAILFTDLLIICKKQSKGSPYQYKMIRPKYMIDKLVEFPKYGTRNNATELTYIFVVMVDDLGSCHTCFTLSESSKDPNGSETLKLWEQKIKEAQYTYNLAVWLNRNPSYHISELDLDLASEYSGSSAKQRKLSHEDYNIEREAKERVATMMYRTLSWDPSFSTEHSHVSSENVSASFIGPDSTPTGRRVPGIDVLLNRWKYPYTAYSPRNSRMSSFQKSTSAASQDDCQQSCNKLMQRAGSSVDNTQQSIIEDEGSPSVTVKVMGDVETESELTSISNPTVIVRHRIVGALEHSDDNKLAGPSWFSGSSNVLKVDNPVVALVHSLPDLSLVNPSERLSRRYKRRSPSPMSKAEQLYRAHKEQLKSRFQGLNQYLKPDNRGSSYPSTSSGRASLTRGLAFSYSFGKPTLSKMGHVVSQGALDQADHAATPTLNTARSERAGFVAKLLAPGTSSDKSDKEKEKAKEKEAQKEKEKKSKPGKKKDDKDD